MAQRRMIDKVVANSQRFLKLPLETQALYFHLVLNADDDGIVEAFPVVRMIGASEDSLGLLNIKNFIRSLNDEMVYFIVDFGLQNTLRKDRIKASKYRDLLGCQTGDGQLSDKRPTFDGIDEVRLDEYRLAESSVVEERQEQAASTDERAVNASTLSSSTSRLQQIVDFCEGNGFGLMNSVNLADLREHLAQSGFDLLKRALTLAASDHKPLKWAYACLNNWKQRNLTTLEDLEKAEAEFQRQKQSRYGNKSKVVKPEPEWSNPDYDYETVVLDDDTQKEFEKLVARNESRKRENTLER
ncbi:DnaD domain protein [Lactovum odontotermitis]